jgi:hypothetical protein
MTPAQLSEALRSLTPEDLARIARSLAADTAADEVDAWRITMTIDRSLRHSHHTRQAAGAARAAAQAVQFAAASHGVALPDLDVTRVARAAAELARALVAGDECERELLQLLDHWVPLLARVA